MAKNPVIESLPCPLHVLAKGTLCDICNLCNINLSARCTTEPKMGYIAPAIWRGIVWTSRPKTSTPEGRFYRWDSSESKPLHPFNWPTALTSDEFIHSKLHQIYSHGNSLMQPIQTTSRNWGDMFQNQVLRKLWGIIMIHFCFPQCIFYFSLLIFVFHDLYFSSTINFCFLQVILLSLWFSFAFRNLFYFHDLYIIFSS